MCCVYVDVSDDNRFSHDHKMKNRNLLIVKNVLSVFVFAKLTQRVSLWSVALSRYV